jgi:alkylation response protein AidB-like acyl-CoA dehydrogenase
VRLDLSEEQSVFKDATRRFIEAEIPLSAVRGLYDSPDGFDRAWWRRAADLGWTSMWVAQSEGGGSLSGRPTADAVIVAEEIGRYVSPGPFLPTNLVAAALCWSGTEVQRAAILPDLLSGGTVATWAYAEPGDRWTPDRFSTSASVSKGMVLLSGEKSYVEAAGAAGVFLVTAASGSGLTQVLVPSGTPGVSVTRGRSVDMTRRFGRVRFDGVRLPVDAVVANHGGADQLVGRQLSLAVALQCAEMIGVAERTLESTIEYGRDRVAFGRPIVSFQALKHRIADMAVWLEGMKAVTEALVDSVDDGSEDACRLASVAKVYVGRHCLDIVDDCVQITGGLGVTWEHDIHMYNRRAVVNRAVFGTPELHRHRLLGLLAGRSGR